MVDDFSASNVNASTCMPEHFAMAGLDETVGMLRTFASATLDDRTVRVFQLSGQHLQGRLHPEYSVEQARDVTLMTTDLASAYRQLASSPAHARFSVIAVPGAGDREVDFYELAALPFGAVESVAAFLRVS